MRDVDVLIVGGGISGLSTAWWLARQGVAVELWECDSRPGGKIRTDQGNGYLTERAASLVMNFRPEVNQLMRESGLFVRKTPRAGAANRYLVQDGRLVPLPMKLGAMIASPLWSLRGKLRLLAEPFMPAGGHAQETVSEFITRRLGREMLVKAMEPFIAGTLASDPDRANAYAVLPRLSALERRYGSLAVGVFVHKVLRRRTACPTESFSFQGGMSTLVEWLARTSGIEIRLGRQATELAMDRRGSWRITGSEPQGEHTLRARQVVLSIPAKAAACLLDPLDPDLGRLLHGIDYAPLSVVHVGLPRAAIDHPLDGTGFLVPRQAGLVLSGCLWASALFPDRAPAGKVLLSCYLGGARAPQAAGWNDTHSVAAVMQGLRPLLGINADPEMVRINRHPQALPLYHGAYQGRMQALDQRLELLPGLHLVADYRGGVSVRDRVTCGYTAAERILSVIGRPAPVVLNRPERLAADTLASARPAPTDTTA
ncbi:MAG: protoporphyrinogen oxidase [Acidiferrobacterales bacterium]